MLIRWLLRIAAAAAVLYALAGLGLFIIQRRLMYFPYPANGIASDWGLPDTETIAIMPEPGVKIVGWFKPAEAGKPIFLYFHGNGGNLANRAAILKELSGDGSGFLAIDYRGYGGSDGKPTERNLIADADASYAELTRRGYEAGRIVIVGESLGSGVAVALAMDHPAKALILDAAFSSAASVAGARYPGFPVAMLMLDTFDSKARIGKVRCPKLFLHGDADPIVPIASGRALFDAAPPPKTFVTVPGAGHVVLGQPGILAKVRAWLAALPT